MNLNTYDIYGNIATLSHITLPVKLGSGYVLDSNCKAIRRSRRSCQALADRIAKKEHNNCIGIIADCGTHYRINLTYLI